MKSYFENQSKYIIGEIKNAITSIKVAVAWITDDEIITALMEAGKKGVKVEIITSAKMFSDEYKKKHIEIISALKSVGNCKVFRIGSETNDFDSLMHHKFSVIDTEIVITGSYNWTKKAKRNNEDVIIINNSENAKNYLDQFEKIKNQYFTKDRLWFDSLSLNWQKALLENINKKGNTEFIIEEDIEVENIFLDPTDLELSKILELKKLELSDLPFSLREDYIEEYFKELLENYENPTDLETQLAYVIAKELYSSITNLTPVLNLKYLEVLDCSGIDIETIKPIQNLENIKELHLSYNDNLVIDMKEIIKLKKLKSFSFHYNKVYNLQVLGNLTGLEVLSTNNVTTDYHWLSNLTKLKELDVIGFEIDDIEILLGLKNLEILNIDSATFLDISPLYKLKNLKKLSVNQGVIKESDYMDFVKKYPLKQ